MRVSIITPLLNAETTVADAVRSVTAQSYPDIEHIVVDGRSSDRSLARVAEHARPDALVISEPDAGLYDALNKGIERATGAVIGLIHADDFLAHPGVVARVAAAFRRSGAQAVYGDLDYVSRTDPARIIRHWRAGPFSQKRLRWGWMPPHPALYLRRQVFDRHGVYDTRYRISADYDAILRYFRAEDFSWCYVPEVLVKMRMGGRSNRCLSQIARKSREDFFALRRNRVGGAGALIAKNLSKLPQFVRRPGPGGEFGPGQPALAAVGKTARGA